VRTAIQTLPTASISQLVTDSGSPSAQLEALSQKGVDVHIATIASGLLDTF